MSCCGSEAGLIALLPDARAAGEEVLLASRLVADGVRQTDLSAPQFAAEHAFGQSRKRSAVCRRGRRHVDLSPGV